MSDVPKHILADAKHYPSGDNAQPFSLRQVNATTFEIRHDSQRARHLLNFEELSSVATLGALRTYLEVSALKHSHKCIYKQETPLTATIRFSEGSSAVRNDLENHLIHGLARRYTERRQFASFAEVPHIFKKWMDQENNDHATTLLWKINPAHGRSL